MAKRTRRIFTETFKAEASGNLLRQGKSMRFTFIDAEKAVYPLVVLYWVMDVGRSGFYAWQSRAPSARAQADKVLETKIEVAFRDSRGTYGSPRIRAQLTAEGVPVSK